jgi:hypothetical protein
VPAQLERTHYFRALYVEGGAQSGVWRGTCKSVVETYITATIDEARERGGGRHALGAVENG